MARRGGNPNLKGNKNSGRRPISEELIKRARELNYKELAKEAVSRHLQAMVDDSISNSDEIKDIALPIVLKDMTIKTEMSGDLKIEGIKFEYEDVHNATPDNKTKDSLGKA